MNNYIYKKSYKRGFGEHTLNNNIHTLYYYDKAENKNSYLGFKHLKKFVEDVETDDIKKFINALYLEKGNILNNQINGKKGYKDLYSIDIIDFNFTKHEILIKFIIDSCETTKKSIDNKDSELSEICNGNYKTIEIKNIFGINSIWCNLQENKRDFKSAAISLDIETGKINNEENCISFSICANSQSFCMTTTEIKTNDFVIFAMLETIKGIVKNKKIIIDVHNLKFDGSYILTYLLKNGWNCVQKFNKDDDKEFKILFAGGLISIDLKYHGMLYQFRDTYRLMASSLNNISKSFIKNSNLIKEKEQTEFNYKKERFENEIYTNTDIIYCINDVVITSYIRKFFNDCLFGEVKLTSAGCAYNEYFLSCRYGCFNTDVLIYSIKNQLTNKKIDSNNFQIFLKKVNGVYCLKDYYNQYFNLGFSDLSIESYNIFVEKINNYKIEIDIKNFCVEHSPFFNYLINIKNWQMDYTINFLCFSSSLGHERYKNKIFNECYNYYFPKLNENQDKLLRKSYFGGITSINADYVGIKLENIKGFSIDINSSYPDKMSNKKMPFGNYKIVQRKTIKTEFEKIETDDYKNKLVIIKITGICKIKPRHIPIFISKSVNGNGGQIWQGRIDRYVTYDEYKIACQTYDMYVNITDMIVFNSYDNLFNAYYKRYYTLKASLKDTALYDIIKVLLNALYGKFGENTFEKMKQITFAEIDNNFKLHYKTVEHELSLEEIEKAKTKYLPIAIFTTSYARCQLINATNAIIKNGGTVLYTDTDSIYCICDTFNYYRKQYKNNVLYKYLSDYKLMVNKQKTNIIIDGSILGAWDLENEFNSFFALAAKRYAYKKNDGKIKIKCAGISKKYVSDFNFDDLNYNSVHKTLQSEIRKNGLLIDDKIKVLSYKENVYQCTDGLSFQSEILYKKGDKIKTIYNEEKEIEKILFKKE